MANTIKIKQSAVASKVPLTTDLSLGELAVNTYDGKLFLKKNVSGTETIVEIGAGGGGGGTTVTVNDTAPLSPIANSLWWDSTNGNLKIYYNDGNTSQWVDASSNTFGGGAGGIADVLGTAPIVSSGGTSPNISITEATVSAAGSMSATDKTKLDGIAIGATANLGTVTSVSGSAPIVSTGGDTPSISINAATISTSGSMSATDKAKLDNIAIGATANVGTVTSVSTGTGLTGGPVTSSGTISLNNTTVTPGDYTLANITVDAQGRITTAANGSAVTLDGVQTLTNKTLTTPSISSPTITGHATIEGATLTGVTGSGNLVLSASPTLTGTATTANLTVTGNLVVSGSTYTVSATNVAYSDNAIELHTPADLSPLTVDDGKDIGLHIHYYKTSDKLAFFGFANDTQELEYYVEGTDTAGVFSGTYGKFKGAGFNYAGSTSGVTLLKANATASGTLTLPAGTDTLVGKDTTDTLTNKTLTSPVLTTPTLGVASATSINKINITTPATGATITIAEGKTFTSSNTLTLIGTDGSSLNVGSGGTLGTGALKNISVGTTAPSSPSIGDLWVDTN